MYELVDCDVNDNSETARTPLSSTCFHNEPLDADSIDEPRSCHLRCDPFDICAVAREHPQIEDGCNSTSLNVCNGIVGETHRHQEYDVLTVADNLPNDKFELCNFAPDVVNEISSCIEHAKFDQANQLVGSNSPPSLRSLVSFQRRQRR